MTKSTNGSLRIHSFLELFNYLMPISGLTSLDWLPLGGNNIRDISPLVMNSGLSEGDFVHLGGNPLSDESINVYIPQLLERGVNVER